MNIIFTSIIVTNLHPNANISDVKEAFSKFGEIKSVDFPKKNPKYQNNYCFVEFHDEYECNNALSAVPPFILNQQVNVHFAKMNKDVIDTLEVCGFNEDTKKDDLYKHFKNYNPRDIKFIKSEDDNKAHALIRFEKQIDRDQAYTHLNKSNFNGDTLIVRFSLIPFDINEKEL